MALTISSTVSLLASSIIPSAVDARTIAKNAAQIKTSPQFFDVASFLLRFCSTQPGEAALSCSGFESF
jgi:hypothetical protein